MKWILRQSGNRAVTFRTTQTWEPRDVIIMLTYEISHGRKFQTKTDVWDIVRYFSEFDGQDAIERLEEPTKYYDNYNEWQKSKLKAIETFKRFWPGVLENEKGYL